MPVKPYTLNAGASLNDALGFIARTVIADNLTDQWLYLPSASRFVPPWTYGAVVPLDGTTTATVVWQTPGNLVAAPFNPTEQVTLTFTDAAMLATNGNSVKTPSTPQQRLATGTVIRSTNATASVTLPLGANSIAVAWWPTAVGSPPSITSVTVVGATSGITYLGLNNPGANGSRFVLVSEVVDSVLTVTLNNQNAGWDFAFVIAAIFDPTVVNALGPGNNNAVLAQAQTPAAPQIAAASPSIVVPADALWHDVCTFVPAYGVYGVTAQVWSYSNVAFSNANPCDVGFALYDGTTRVVLGDVGFALELTGAGFSSASGSFVNSPVPWNNGGALKTSTGPAPIITWHLQCTSLRGAAASTTPHVEASVLYA